MAIAATRFAGIAATDGKFAIPFVRQDDPLLWIVVSLR
jgi:hypothetical protein